MGTLLSYSIISSFVMLAMYLVYRLFLARDNQHSFNRAVLLLIYLLSFVAAPMIFSLELGVTANYHMPETFTFEWTHTATKTADQTPNHSESMWGTILIWIFIIGAVVSAIRTIIVWLRLSAVIRSGRKIKCKGYILVVTENVKLAPFSWMRYIVVNSTDYNRNTPAIIAHELKHITCFHWIDLLIAQTVCILAWFNPVAWLMRDELMLVHEYQADMAVIKGGHDIREYHMLLIKKAVGSRFPSLANSLNHSKLKKRITMMYKEKSRAGLKLKALALVPALALAIGVTGVPAVRAAVSAISDSEVSLSKVSENPPQEQTEAKNSKTIAIKGTARKVSAPKGNKNRHEGKTDVKSSKITNININNNGKETTVTIKGEEFGNQLTVSGGTLTTGGKTYNANSIKCDMTNGAATIAVTFPFSDELKDPGMTLMINGSEESFDIKNFARNAKSIEVTKTDGPETKAKITVSVNGQPTALEDMTIYLDGEKITYLDLNNLPPDKIGSISVDNDGKAIRITSNKSGKTDRKAIGISVKEIPN